MRNRQMVNETLFVLKQWTALKKIEQQTWISNLQKKEQNDWLIHENKISSWKNSNKTRVPSFPYQTEKTFKNRIGSVGETALSFIAHRKMNSSNYCRGQLISKSQNPKKCPHHLPSKSTSRTWWADSKITLNDPYRLVFTFLCNRLPWSVGRTWDLLLTK